MYKNYYNLCAFLLLLLLYCIEINEYETTNNLKIFNLLEDDYEKTGKLCVKQFVLFVYLVSIKRDAN